MMIKNIFINIKNYLTYKTKSAKLILPYQPKPSFKFTAKEVKALTSGINSAIARSKNAFAKEIEFTVDSDSATFYAHGHQMTISFYAARNGEYGYTVTSADGSSYDWGNTYSRSETTNGAGLDGEFIDGFSASIFGL